MSRLEEFRFRVNVQGAQKAQLDALLEALGGRAAGWHGFQDSEELLSYVRDTFLFAHIRPDLKDVQSVPELVERLGVKLDIDPVILEAARAADKETHRRLDEHAHKAMAEYVASPEYKTFLAELDQSYGRKAL
jgi:hypothetical protein